MATWHHIIWRGHMWGSLSIFTIFANGVVTLDSIGGIKNAGA